LVDEIQDLSPLQLRLVRALLPPDGTGFFGIGDPAQAIYGFRGAHPDTVSALRMVWPELDLFTLSDSHRAGPGILAAASAVLGADAAGGQLHAARPLETRLSLFAAPDARKEANWVADSIAGLIGWGGHTELDRGGEAGLPSGACSPGEVAVLVRAKALMPPLRDALDRLGIPCSSPEAAPFWTDAALAELLCLAAARFRVPLQQTLAPHLARPLPDPLPALPEAYWEGEPDRLERLTDMPRLAALRGVRALRELLEAWKTYQGWPGMLEVVRLGQAMDLLRTKAEQVQLMTLHASKGLEFRAVFLPTLEEGLLPFFVFSSLLHPPASGKNHERAVVAEERRLLYVGITRASEAVFVSHAARRTLYGRELALPPSRFLQTLPDSFRKSRLSRHTRVAVRQMSLLS
jgi:superfamily I DNA/RNA helicase